MSQRNPNGSGNFRRLKDGRVAWRQTIDGKTRQISAKTLKELKAKIKEIENLPIITDKITVEIWFDKWLATYIKPLKKPATYNQYNDIYKKHIKPLIGHRKIEGLKPINIQEVISEMNKKNLSTWTMKHARKIMNIAFSKAVDDKYLSESPCKKIEIPTKQQKEMKVLTPIELSKLFKQLSSSRWIWAIKFALVTGLRRGELLALKWTDIDFVNRKITVERSNSLSGLGETKSSKVHYVPLADIAIKFLEEQKKMLESEFNPILHNEELKETLLIFPNESGLMLKPGSFYTLVARAAKKAGVYANPHCFRHTFVYNVKDELSIKDIQNALGHEESTTTLDIYGDMINDKTKKVANTINSAFEKLNNEVKEIDKKKPGKVIQFPNAK